MNGPTPDQPLLPKGTTPSGQQFNSIPNSMRVQDELIEIDYVPSTADDPSLLYFKCCGGTEELECCPKKGWCHRFWRCKLDDEETKRMNACVGFGAGVYVLAQGAYHAATAVWPGSNHTQNQTEVDSANLASLAWMGATTTLAAGFYGTYTSFSTLFCRPPKEHQT